MRSLFVWSLAVAVGIYAYYDLTSLEKVKNLLAVMIAGFIINFYDSQRRIEKLEGDKEAKDEFIGNLMSDVDELRAKLASLESTVDGFDNDELKGSIDLLEARLVDVEERS